MTDHTETTESESREVTERDDSQAESEEAGFGGLSVSRRQVLGGLASIGVLGSIASRGSGAAGSGDVSTNIGGGTMASEISNLEIKTYRGLFSDRPAAGVDGRVYEVDDPGHNEHGAVYFDNGSSWELVDRQFGSVHAEQVNTIHTVGAGGEYASVKAAIDEITDAAADNRYVLWLLSDTDEPGEITAKSHVDVWLNGHDIIRDSDSGGDTVVVDGLTDAYWYEGTIRRQGAATEGSHAVEIKTTTEDTVEFENVDAINETTANSFCSGYFLLGDAAAKLINCYGEGGDGGSDCHGISMRSSAVPTLKGTEGKGGEGGKKCAGIWMQDQAAPTLKDCHGEGGDSGDNCYGIITRNQTAPTLDGVYGVGGAGGAVCHGIDMRHESEPELVDSVGHGGDGGQDCRGINTADTASPEIAGCVGYGGDGGTTCRGVFFGGASRASVSGTIGLGGDGDTDCPGIGLEQNAAPDLSGCIGSYKVHSEIYNNSNTSNESFSPTSSHPWMLENIAVHVTSAGSAGSTLDIGTTSGGSEIAADIPIDTAYSEQAFDFERVSRSPSEDIHLSVTDTSAEFHLTYTWATNYGSRHGLLLNTHSYASLSGCTFIGNRASAGGYVDSDALAASNYAVSLSSFQTGDPSSNSGLTAASASSDDPIKMCVFDGGYSNVEPQQDPLRTPYSSTSPTYTIGDGWRQPSANRPVLVEVEAIAETDGSTSAHINIVVDEDGDSTSDYISTIAYADQNLPAGSVVQGSISAVLVPPGGQYQISQSDDPNNTNAVQDHREFVL